MSQIEFQITIKGKGEIKGDKLILSLQDVELRPNVMMLSLGGDSLKPTVKSMTLHDKVLRAAQELHAHGHREFAGSDIIHHLNRTENVKANSIRAHVIAAAPNHPSQKHYTAKRDYLEYLGSGKYRLAKSYIKS